MYHFILVFASFFVMFLMLFGVLILRAPHMDFPDADEVPPPAPDAYYPTSMQR